MDNHWRSITKTISYRVVIVVLDFMFVYLFTRRTDIAALFVLVSNLYTTIAYYLHERLWNKVSWGKVRA